MTREEMAMIRAKAKRISERGWRFAKREGPRGVYYDGHGPQGRRLMSGPRPDEQLALAVAIEHAFDF